MAHLVTTPLIHLFLCKSCIVTYSEFCILLKNLLYKASELIIKVAPPTLAMTTIAAVGIGETGCEAVGSTAL